MSPVMMGRCTSWKYSFVLAAAAPWKLSNSMRSLNARLTSSSASFMLVW